MVYVMKEKPIGTIPYEYYVVRKVIESESSRVQYDEGEEKNVTFKTVKFCTTPEEMLQANAVRKVKVGTPAKNRNIEQYYKEVEAAYEQAKECKTNGCVEYPSDKEGYKIPAIIPLALGWKVDFNSVSEERFNEIIKTALEVLSEKIDKEMEYVASSERVLRMGYKSKVNKKTGTSSFDPINYKQYKTYKTKTVKCFICGEPTYDDARGLVYDSISKGDTMKGTDGHKPKVICDKCETEGLSADMLLQHVGDEFGCKHHQLLHTVAYVCIKAEDFSIKETRNSEGKISSRVEVIYEGNLLTRWQREIVLLKEYTVSWNGFYLIPQYLFKGFMPLNEYIEKQEADKQKRSDRLFKKETVQVINPEMNVNNTEIVKVTLNLDGKYEITLNANAYKEVKVVDGNVVIPAWIMKNAKALGTHKHEYHIHEGEHYDNRLYTEVD